jgi:hypothetical protein
MFITLITTFRNVPIDRSVHSKFPMEAILPLDVFEEVLRNLATSEDTVTLKLKHAVTSYIPA